MVHWYFPAPLIAESDPRPRLSIAFEDERVVSFLSRTYIYNSSRQDGIWKKRANIAVLLFAILNLSMSESIQPVR